MRSIQPIKGWGGECCRVRHEFSHAVAGRKYVGGVSPRERLIHGAPRVPLRNERNSGQRFHWRRHCRLAPQRIDGHPSDVKDAVDDVGPPDVIAEGKDLFSQISKCVITGPVLGGLRVSAQFRADRLAVFELYDGDRPVGRNHVARCILRRRGDSRS